MRISDWSSDVCSSDLARSADGAARRRDAADAQRRAVAARAALTWGGGVPGCEGKGGNREQGVGNGAGAVLQVHRFTEAANQHRCCFVLHSPFSIPHSRSTPHGNASRSPFPPDRSEVHTSEL